LSQTPTQFYTNKTTSLNSKLKELKGKLRSFVLYRLLAFIGIIIPWWPLNFLDFNIQIVVSIVFIILFFILIKKNKKLNDQKRFLEQQLELLANEEKCLQKDYLNNETGEAFKENDHAYIFDLDIFGIGSLYQYITRASTQIGKQRLAHWLSKPQLDIDELKRRQEAIEELSNFNDLRLEVQTHGLLTEEKEGDVDRVIAWVKEEGKFDLKGWHRILLIVVPVFSIGVIISLSFGLISGQLFGVLICLPLIITGIYLKNTQETYKNLDKGFKAVAKFHDIFYNIENQRFNCDRLIEIQKNAVGAHQALTELNQVISAFDQRLNLLVAFFMNMVLAWDLKCMVSLAEWQKKYQGDTELWFDSLAQFEAISSLANFRYNHHKETIFPSFNSTGEMNAQGLGHPFLMQENRVDNDFSINNKNFAIITGANMAGKSTFLRTLGISIVLANAGSSIIAKSFNLQPIQIFSSMRTSDSLQKNESYFYTELLRLYHLVNRLAKGEKLFIILDEILKGTNSKDKAEGSYKFIKKILLLDAMGVIATHDLSLCEIEKEFPDRVSNLYFDVTIKDDDLSFDYKLRQGICSNMNATFLMKKMGITD